MPDHFGLFTLFLLLAASLALYIRLMATGMLSNLYLIILMVVLIVLNAVSVIVQLPLRRNKAGKLIMGIVSLLLSGAMLYGVVAVNSVQSALSKIVGKMTETEITEVRVMNDNPATSMGDTRGYTFGYIADADTKNTQSILDEISKSFGTIKSKGYDSMTALADALYDDEVDAILINQGYVDLLTEKDGYTDFRDQTRVLYTYTTTHEVDPIVPNTSITKEPFVVYCSGIDARVDDISAKSRSDVNILAVVNPTTKQILLVKYAARLLPAAGTQRRVGQAHPRRTLRHRRVDEGARQPLRGAGGLLCPCELRGTGEDCRRARRRGY